jgi:site-specific DNA recombinase
MTLDALADKYNIDVREKAFKGLIGKGMIEGILFNVKYCGDAILQQSVTVDPIMKKRKKNTGEALMYNVQNSHPAIVTREKFNKAQEERARRRTFAPKSQKATITATGKYSRYALSQVLICAECGSPYKRVHWNIRGKKSIVWRCVNRLDHGTQYCKGSPTLREGKLKEAVVRAIRQFNEQDANTYTTLMKATIAEAIGFDGSDDEKELLERQVNGLNEKMIAIVNESIASGEDIESREAEIKEIADTIEDLKRRIQIITESSMKNAEYADRIAEIERIITERASHQNEYDDSIVRQMVECIKVYADKHIEVIFGGGYAVEETVE